MPDEPKYEVGKKLHDLFLEKVEQQLGRGSAGRLMTPWGELEPSTKRVWHESAQALLSSQTT